MLDAANGPGRREAASPPRTALVVATTSSGIRTNERGRDAGLQFRRRTTLVHLEGEYLIFLEGREWSCPAGSFIHIPAGLPHGARVGRVPSRKLNIYTPAAMVGYFDEVANAVAAGDVDPDTLSRIALRSSMEVLGPVPEGYV